MTTDRIALDPKVLGGKPVIRGTRITVTMILELLEDGTGFDKIVSDFYPQISAEDISACLEYARSIVEGEEIHFVEEKPLPS